MRCVIFGRRSKWLRFAYLCGATVIFLLVTSQFKYYSTNAKYIPEMASRQEILNNFEKEIVEKTNGANEKLAIADSRAPQPLKIVVVGHEKVGKTSIVSGYVYKFWQIKAPKIRNNHFSKKVEGEDFTLDISEMSGSKLANRDDYYRSAEGVICVFSILDMDSFEATNEFREQILRVKNPDNSVPIVLVGNMGDMREQRIVTFEEAKEKAEQWGVPYVETSAKRRENVDKVFSDLMREIKRRKEGAQTSSGNNAAASTSAP